MRKNLGKNKKNTNTSLGNNSLTKNVPGNTRDFTSKKDGQVKDGLDGSQLFSFFTANIIKEDVVFTR